MCERGQADNSMASEGAADKLLMLLGVTRALLNEHSKIYSVRVCMCVWRGDWESGNGGGGHNTPVFLKPSFLPECLCI